MLIYMIKNLSKKREINNNKAFCKTCEINIYYIFNIVTVFPIKYIINNKTNCNNNTNSNVI